MTKALLLWGKSPICCNLRRPLTGPLTGPRPAPLGHARTMIWRKFGRLGDLPHYSSARKIGEAAMTRACSDDVALSRPSRGRARRNDSARISHHQVPDKWRSLFPSTNGPGEVRQAISGVSSNLSSLKSVLVRTVRESTANSGPPRSSTLRRRSFMGRRIRRRVTGNTDRIRGIGACRTASNCPAARPWRMCPHGNTAGNCVAGCVRGL